MLKFYLALSVDQEINYQHKKKVTEQIYDSCNIY